MQATTIAFAVPANRFLNLNAPFSQMKKPLLFAAVFLLVTLLAGPAAAQAPTVSYPSPQTFTQGTPVTLSPTSSNVGSPGYSYSDAGSTYKLTTVAYDQAGNFYYAASPTITGSQFIYVVTQSGTKTVGSGFTQILSIAADATGNIYFTEPAQQNSVMKIPAGSNTAAPFFTVGNSNVTTTAIDGAGYIYAYDNYNGVVIKINPTTASAVQTISVGSGKSIVVDIGGYIYSATGGSAVTKYSPAGMNLGTVSPTLPSGLGAITMDPGGNIFFSINTNGPATTLYELPAGSNAFSMIMTKSSSYISSLANDGYGDVEAVDAYDSKFFEILPNGGYFINNDLPPGLTLNGSTGVISGTPTAASPATTYTVTAWGALSQTTDTLAATATVTITVNALPPAAINSITANNTYSNSGTVQYTVNFGAPVTGLSAGNFSLTTTGAVSGASIASVSPSSGSAYTVTVNTGTGEGTIGLNLANATGLTPGISTSLPFTGGTTTIDRTPPVATIGAPSVNVVSGGGTQSVSYAVTYADANFGNSNLTASGITLNTTGTATGTVGVSGSGTSYTVTISNISGNGTLGISVGAGYASDKAGNTDAGAGPSSTVTVVPNVSPSIGYAGPQGYAVNTAITPLTPVETVNTSVFANTTNGTGLALDYNGNAYIISSSSEIFQYQPGNANAFPLPANSTANPAIAPISVSTSTLLTAFNGAFRAMDITNGQFSPPVTACSAQPGGLTLVAAVHPSSGPEIAMINRGYDAGGQLAFLTRTAGTWSNPALISNAFPGSAIAINNYPGGLKLAYIGTDNNLYYATYSGGTWSAVSPWGTPNISLSGVTAFALDAQGDVWYGNGAALNELAPGSTSPITVATLPSAPNAIAFDITGNLYVNLGTTIEKLAVINNFQVSPGLPAGLSISSGTGVISGTPTVVSPATNYTVTATAGGSNLSAVVNFQTISTPTLSYGSPVNTTVGTSITAVTPASTSVLPQKYNSTPTTFASVTAPTGVAVDAAGNVYVADNSNNIDKFAPGVVQPTSLGLGYSPLAIDGTGNFYFTNLATSTLTGIYQFSVIPPGSTTAAYGSPPTAPLSGSTCTGIAVDAAGNAYVSDNNANESVVEYTDGVPVNAQGNPFAIGNGFSSASGVATDAAGNVYVSDAGAGTIDLIPASRAQWTTIATGLGAPANICIDGAGNLYYSDNNANTISELPAGSTTPVLIASGLGTIKALAIDGKGNLYAADYTNNVIDRFNPTGGYYINPVLPPGMSFNSSTGAVNGTPTAPTTAGAAVNYTVTAYNTLGSASAVQSLAVSTALPVVSYGGARSFNIGKAITPLTPASTGVAAQGYNPVPGFMDFQFGAPYAVAVDTALNVFVADPYNNQEMAVSSDLAPPGDAPPYHEECFAKGKGQYIPLDGSEGASYGMFCVATDSTGNIFFTSGSLPVHELSPFPAMVESVLSNGATKGFCVSTDSQGNLFGTNQTGSVVQLFNGTTIASGFINPTGIAIDGPGNIFVGDRGNNTLYKIPVGGGTQIAVATGFNAPYQLAADGTGNIFIGDGGNGVVKELPAGGGPVITVIPNLKTPNGVAVDVKGALYVADAGFAQVRKYTPSGGYYISPSLPAGLSFNNSTGVISGTPTVVTPVKDYKITAYNASGSTQTTLRFGVTPPSSALANLAVSTGALSPAFASATLAYSVSVPYTAQQITVTPTGVDGNASVTINGTAIANGNSSTPISLQVGINTITIVVTASDHSSTQTYTVTVTRAAPSSNAQLASAGIGYIMVGGNVEAVVTPTTSDPTATVTVNGAAVTSGAASNPIPLSPGSNTIIITVTAQNGVSKLTYKITVEGPLSAISTLSSLTISAGTLSPAFSGSTNSYTDKVSSSVSSVTLTPTTTDPNATVTVNGTAVTSGTASGNIALPAGNTIIPTVVTAQDGVTTTTYTVTVTRPSNIATLANLQLSTGTLSPVFASGTGSYTASVGNTIASVTVTPTTSDGTATVTVNGASVNPGSASGAIPLVVGSNTITTVVTAQDGVTTKTYTVIVTRLSNNANLVSLAISAGTLTPAFATATPSYTAAVANAVTTITVTAKSSNPASTVTVNGIAVSPGVASGAIPLVAGPNTIAVKVTAQDGVTTKTYTITVTRAPSNNAGLSSLVLGSGTLTPAFATGTTSYTASVASSVASVTVTPTSSDGTGTITVNGTPVASGSASASIPLAVGTNTITTVVTAPDGVTNKTYTVTVTRPASNANLVSLGISTGSLTPAFATATTSYTTSVANTVSTIKVTPKSSNSAATITVNGTTVASGTASGSIPLNVGPNTITTIVTAQDGITTKTYTLTVTRAPSNIADLSKLTLSTGTLTPVFAAATTSYAASVGNGITSVTATPVTSDATATVTVNGTGVSSGTASGAIALNVGPNTITTVITAQDGITTKTYTVTVTRALPANANLAALTTSAGALSPAFNAGTTSYTASVANSVTSATVTPKSADGLATITVNGIAVTSGKASGAIPLNVGANVITTIVTAENGTTTLTYTITVTRATGSMNSVYEPISVSNPTGHPQMMGEEIMVHQGLSPNGDGINDFLMIDGITNYPDNKLIIMNRSGQLVFEAKGYDNSTRVFDGHSNKNGAMQLPGTYFYSLDFTANGVTKHKTGFIILKY